jgi:hypothetical protein
MKKLYILLFASVSAVASNAATPTFPSDTLIEAKYALSSRNAEAQSGKYKKLDLALSYDAATRTFTLDAQSEREIDAYLEISDQDENVIYFKQTQIKPGDNRITFVAEDGHQSLFRLSFSEPYADKPAVFIIRQGDGTEPDSASDVLR